MLEYRCAEHDKAGDYQDRYNNPKNSYSFSSFFTKKHAKFKRILNLPSPLS